MAKADERGDTFAAMPLEYSTVRGARNDAPRRAAEAFAVGCVGIGLILLAFASATVQPLLHIGGAWPLLFIGVALFLCFVSLLLTVGASFRKKTPRDLLRWAWIVVLLQSGFWAWVVYHLCMDHSPWM